VPGAVPEVADGDEIDGLVGANNARLIGDVHLCMSLEARALSSMKPFHRFARGTRVGL
jgi:hypothetical protein